MNGTGVDLRLFTFDYWSTWSAFFLNSHGRIYARYGLRKPRKNQDESLMSVEGFKTVMKGVLKAHQKGAELRPVPLPEKPLLPESFKAVPAKMRSGKACMHCHHVWNFGNKERPRPFSWTSPEIPLPDRIGLTLDVDKGNVVLRVAAGSVAATAGIESGDQLLSMNGTAILSAADVSWVLNLSPKQKPIPVTFDRAGEQHEVSLTPPPR